MKIIFKFFNPITLFLLFISFCTSAQTINVSGNVTDTLNKKGLEHAVVMAVKITDSTLQNFTRTSYDGSFTLQIPQDTIQILITHPKFEDREFFLFNTAKSTDIDFGNIILPPKGLELNEVTVFSNNEPIFFRGDTLVMVADSFKTSINANVEDLFKKLPGFKVDGDGAIKVHGEDVDKVYVDGDEFFGTDPTIATKNLPANAIEEVEVFEEKSKDGTTDETEKVINLKLKEDSKQGYFGKVNGATDFMDFYEGEVLLNKFKGDQKISVFGLGTNTPRSNFNWKDSYQYGLTEETGRWNEDGDMISINRSTDLGEGIPSNRKAGFYFTDKWGKKNNLKIGSNFTYTNRQIVSANIINTQFLLQDTSFQSTESNLSNGLAESYSLNLSAEWQIDSANKVIIGPRFYSTQTLKDENINAQYYSQENVNTRVTNTDNKFNNRMQELDFSAKYIHDFKQRNHKFSVLYNNQIQNGEGRERFDTEDIDLLNQDTLNSFNRKRDAEDRVNLNQLTLEYKFPLSKLIFAEAIVNSSYALNDNLTKTRDYEGNVSTFNNLLSSDFSNTVFSNKAGIKFQLETKKHKLWAAGYYNNSNLRSKEFFNDISVDKTFENFLPRLGYQHKFSRSKKITFKYEGNIRNPSLNQLQPLVDFDNPNNLYVGNINLTNQYENKFSVRFFTYKATSGSHTYFGLNYSFFNDAFSSSLSYDELGRAIRTPINVDGNESGSVYFGTTIPFFKQKLAFSPNLNANRFLSSSLINNQENKTENNFVSASGELTYQTDSLELFLTGGYNFNYATYSLTNTVQRFNTLRYGGGFTWKTSVGINFKSSIENTINQQRADGFNLEILIWDASISKEFLAKKNLIISVDLNDILDQNTTNNRSVQDNLIIDSRTNIIGRYFLLRAVYKFNVLKGNNDGNPLQD